MKTGFTKTSTYEIIREEFTRIVNENALESEKVMIWAEPLSPNEAIGNPDERDYPLIIGRERMMQAEFRGALGQAFTDMYGSFSGRLSDIVAIELTNNFRRAIFIASINAVMRHLGLIAKTMHCRDNEPKQCSYELAKYIEENFSHPKVAMVGFQPRMVEALSRRFELKVTDMDNNNIGTEKFGVEIHSPERTPEHLEWCDIAVVTGTTIINNTFDQFRIAKPVVYYGVSISGVAKILGLTQFCCFGH